MKMVVYCLFVDLQCVTMAEIEIECSKLNWYSHLKQFYVEIFNSNNLSDVTLVCDDGKEIKAHKLILASCSTFLKEILSNCDDDDPTIYFTGVMHQELKSIVEMMYLGKVDSNSVKDDILKSLDIKTDFKKNMNMDMKYVTLKKSNR